MILRRILDAGNIGKKGLCYSIPLLQNIVWLAWVEDGLINARVNDIDFSLLRIPRIFNDISLGMVAHSDDALAAVDDPSEHMLVMRPTKGIISGMPHGAMSCTVAARGQPLINGIRQISNRLQSYQADTVGRTELCHSLAIGLLAEELKV